MGELTRLHIRRRPAALELLAAIHRAEEQQPLLNDAQEAMLFALKMQQGFEDPDPRLAPRLVAGLNRLGWRIVKKTTEDL